MAKRFIDTGLFDDDWFMDLSKDAKLLWVYFITKCDHAGIIKLNEKLCKVQTDIKDLPGVIKQLGNRLVTVSEHLYFIPKFVEYQYPGFPDCNFKAAKSAIAILGKYGILKEGNITVPKELLNTSVTVTKELDNSYGIGKSIGKSIGKEEKEESEEKKPPIPFDTFWNLYDKKIDRGKCEPKWDRLTDKEKEDCITKLPAYIKATPDKKFRRDPETYLNNKSWENEVIEQAPVVIDTPKTYEEMLKMTESNPDAWKRYQAVKRNGERKAVFVPISQLSNYQ